MFRKPLLLLAVTLALSNFALAQEAPEYGPAKGTLLIIGGGNLNGSGIYEQFIELAGGKDKEVRHRSDGRWKQECRRLPPHL